MHKELNLCQILIKVMRTPMGPVVVQTLYFIALNSHMTPHQVQKIKWDHPHQIKTRNTQTKERPKQLLERAKKDPARRQWVWTHADHGSGQTHGGNGSGLSPTMTRLQTAVTRLQTCYDPSKSASKLDFNASKIVSNASNLVSNASKLVFIFKSKYLKGKS